MIPVRRASMLLLLIFLASLFPSAPFAGQFTTKAASAAVPPQPETRSSGPLQQRQLPSLTVQIVVAPAPVVVGETATISVTITNQAAHSARSLTTSLAVPDGTIPISNDGLVSPSAGWRWSHDQLAAQASVTFSATVHVIKMPRGNALVAHAQATAAGLELPIHEISGALAVERDAHASTPFVPGQAAQLRSADGQVEVQFPAKAAARALTLTYDRRPAASEKTPPPIAGTKRGFGAFFLNATDDRGQAVHQFAAPVTLKVTYTEEQLQALGIA